jgi:hypothetical protein
VPTTLKDKVTEFAEIAKALPENLQATCFELLLRHHLEGGKHQQADPAKPAATDAKAAATAEVITLASGNAQHDLKNTDLHLKVKKFLEKYTLSLDQLNNLFFKENDEIKTLYEDLKTTKTSENQIRITLLLALRNAVRNGDFEASVESVREECAQRKSYDSKNFNANYNNNKASFDFEKFDKDTKLVRLSEEGKKLLAQVIQELQ